MPARRDFLEQASVGQVPVQGRRSEVLPWAVHALRVGGTTHVPVCEPQAFPAPGALDLPGTPVPTHPGTPRTITPTTCPGAAS